MNGLWVVATGVASIAALCVVAFQAGRSFEGRRTRPPRPSTWLSARDGWARFLKIGLDSEPTDINLVGYSVHALVDQARPLIVRSLGAGRRVRILALDPDSDGLSEKSRLEQPGTGIPLLEFQRRGRDNLDRSIQSLESLRDQVQYMDNVARVDLQIRIYNQFPVWRGVSAGSSALISSYLQDPRQPGRLLPHAVAIADGGQESEVLSASFGNWFDYLWTTRARPTHTRLIAFDLYDTILKVDSSRQEACRKQMAEHLGVLPADVVGAWNATRDASNRGELPHLSDRTKRIQELLGLAATTDATRALAEMERSLLRTGSSVHPDAIGLLKQLRLAGYRLGLLTNCSSSVQYALDQQLPLSLFDHVVLSHSVGALKPEPQIYQHLLDQAGVAAAECVFVGDGNNDELSGAQACGIRAVKVAWSGQPSPDPAATVCLESLSGLKESLETTLS